MGGYGSGNGRFASQMDEFHKLDLTTFQGEWFERGRSGTVTWSRAGRETGSIGYRLGHDFMELSYVSGREPDRQRVCERFDIAFTEQPFGGRRRWLICKGCCRRCRVLIGGRYFRCRRCYRATYPSQYEPFRVRGLAKAETARERVGAEPGIANLWPKKPNGMHWRTYRRLESFNWDAALAVEDVLKDYLGRSH